MPSWPTLSLGAFFFSYVRVRRKALLSRTASTSKIRSCVYGQTFQLRKDFFAKACKSAAASFGACALFCLVGTYRQQYGHVMFVSVAQL